jgi:hypothetical protein
MGSQPSWCFPFRVCSTLPWASTLWCGHVSPAWAKHPCPTGQWLLCDLAPTQSTQSVWSIWAFSLLHHHYRPLLHPCTQLPITSGSPVPEDFPVWRGNRQGMCKGQWPDEPTSLLPCPAHLLSLTHTDGFCHSTGFRRTWMSPPHICCNQMLEASCADRWVGRQLSYCRTWVRFVFQVSTFVLQQRLIRFSLKDGDATLSR